MQKPPASVLVVDRDREPARRLIEFLRRHQFEVVAAGDGEAAFNALEARAFDALVVAWDDARIDGEAVLRRAIERRPGVCAILTTSGAAFERAVEAMGHGACDVQVEPLQLAKLLAVLNRGLAHQALAARAADIEAQLDERLALDRFTGRSRAIQRVVDQVRSIAGTRATVLIEGEPGTGKGLVAQAIHRHGPRRAAPFVRVDLETLAPGAEGELFGHERGGTVLQRGALEHADGGTLFLDEIGAAPLSVQVKLLRFLSDRAFERGGGGETLKSDVRLVASTCRDLAAAVERGAFREDLFQRLGVIRIAMPPLRDRLEDLPLLVETFVRDLNRRHGRKVTGASRAALDRFLDHSWPGNVRELLHTLEGMVTFASGKRPLDVADLPPALRGLGDAPGLEVAVGMTVAEAERRLIGATLEHAGNDKKRAAAMLGIGLRTLYRKLREYGLH